MASESSLPSSVTTSILDAVHIDVGLVTDGPLSFVIPDLISYWDFPLAYHPDADRIEAQSFEWLTSNIPNLSPQKHEALRGLQAGQLAACCHPYASSERLRIVSDFVIFLFELDDISDGMMARETDALANVVMNALWHPDRHIFIDNEDGDGGMRAGKIAADYWLRCIQGCAPGPQSRFKETMAQYFEGVNVQTKARERDHTLDLESYVSVRRETSGCRPCWALIEYTLDIELPDYVVDDPIVAALNQGADDIVSWSNDICSYDVEQSRGDTHNMVAILMYHHGHNLQSAVDTIGRMCMELMDSFLKNAQRVPSWGPEIDVDVQRYVVGLKHWITGNLHWSFQSSRYFGSEGPEVKKTRTVTLSSGRVESGMGY